MRLLYIAILLLCSTGWAAAAPVRIKDLANIDGVRGNDLVGYGLVVGLNGSGDSLRNSPFTEEIMAGLLERLGVNVTDEAFRPKNVAAVIVTATLPPFARTGSQININVAAIGDAKSLLGGTLVMTPLNAADGEIYAVAQGSVLAGGAEASGAAASVVQGVPTTGTITIDTSALGRVNPARLMGQIETITVEPESAARVVIDHKSGTIVMGEDVRISRVAVSQGNLTLRVREAPVVSQPNPFAPGETVVVPRTQAEITQEPGIGFAEVSGESSLSDVVAGLNALGIRPRDMIDILKAVHATGALHAELVVN